MRKSWRKPIARRTASPLEELCSKGTEDLINDALFIYFSFLELSSLSLIVQKDNEIFPVFLHGDLNPSHAFPKNCIERELLKSDSYPIITKIDEICSKYRKKTILGLKGNVYVNKIETPFAKFLIFATSERDFDNKTVFALLHLTKEIKHFLSAAPLQETPRIELLFHTFKLIPHLLSYPYSMTEALYLMTKEVCTSFGFPWIVVRFKTHERTGYITWPRELTPIMEDLLKESFAPFEGLIQEKRDEMWIIKACYGENGEKILIAFGRKHPVVTEHEKTVFLILPPLLYTVIEALKASERLRRTNLETILTLVRTIEARDIYTKGHSEGVAYYATKIAKYLGFDKSRLEKLRHAALLHDIGKIGIPDVVLLKPRKLSKEEWYIIKQHPQLGYLILKEMKLLRDIAIWVKHHHERWDGKGYPDGLAGEDIPLESRILAVADALEAMLSDRPYRKALSFEEAKEKLKEGAGTQWDPAIVKAAIRAIDKPRKTSRDQNTFYRKMEKLRYEEALAPMKLAVLYKIAEEIEKFSELRKLLYHVLKTVKDLRGKDDIYFIYLKERNRLVARAVIGLDGIEGFSLPLDEGIVGWVARERKGVLIQDTTKDNRYVPPPGERTLSEVAVPLISGNKLIGVLNIESKEKNAFSQSDFKFLKAISSYLAAVIELALSYKGLKDAVLHDYTTGAYSFKYAADRFKEFAEMSNRTLAIAFLDIDNFKFINDTYGHAVGDKILKEFVNSIKLYLKPIDTIARYGGDEFVLLLPGISKENALSLLKELRERILNRDFYIEPADLHIKIDFSYGISTYPKDGKSIADLIYKADKRMYRMKKSKEKTLNPSI